MKIKANLFREYIKKASLDGDIVTINLDFNDKGLATTVKNAINTTMTITRMNKEAFEEYEEFGELFVKDSRLLLKYLNTFDHEVTLEKVDDYILKMYDDTREGFVILGAEVVCENIHRGATLEDKTNVVLPLNKAEISKTVKDISSIGIDLVTIRKEGSELSFEIGRKGESDFFRNILNVDEGENATITLGPTFLKLYNVLDAEFVLRIGNDIPVIVIENGEFIDFKCIIAPVDE